MGKSLPMLRGEKQKKLIVNRRGSESLQRNAEKIDVLRDLCGTLCALCG